MTNRQKIEIEQSEKRQRINALLGQAELSDDERGELETLTKRMQNLELEMRAAIVSDDQTEREIRAQFGDDPEARELRALQQRFDVGRVFDSLIEKRELTDGPEAELQKHYSIGSNQIPLDALRVAPQAPEHRAITTAPANVGASEQPVVMPVFSEGDAAFLGVDMPRVPSGESVFPVLTNRPTVGGTHTDSSEVVETKGEFSAESLEPARLQASFFYRRTDAAKFRGMREALRQALSAGLTEALDKEVIDQIVADVARTDASVIDTFGTYRSKLVYGRIDGRFASMETDTRALVGSATLTHMSGLYRGNTADDSAVDSVRRISGGLRVSPHVAAVAANKQDTLVRLGMRRDAVAPLWEGITLIPDEITGAKKGEITITRRFARSVQGDPHGRIRSHGNSTRFLGAWYGAGTRF